MLGLHAMRRLYAVLIPLALAICGVSAVALSSGLDEARLAASGARRDVAVEELAGARGWVAVFGCVRHDLAVGVGPSGRAYRVGAQAPESEERDRVFTPLSARDDCDEDKPPKRLLKPWRPSARRKWGYRRCRTAFQSPPPLSLPARKF